MQAELNWLEDPAVFQVNRLPAHSDHTWYRTQQELAAGCQALCQSLCGRWLFAWSPAPAARPADFYREDFDLSGFGGIQVPGHIELQGFGQIQYINTMYPWDGRSFLRPPQIDWNDDPVGSYATFFDLEQDLQGKRVCISFQGVEQAFYVWLNGQFVGYSEDSFTPADFDLTPYVRPAGNRLCVEVYKRSSAAWLEDQDFFRFSGIFREVYLYAKPPIHLEDMWLQAGLEEDLRTGLLETRLRFSREKGGGSLPLCDPAAVRVECRIAAPGGGVLWQGPLALSAAPDGCLTAAPLRFGAVRPWSHSDPCLYTVTLAVYDAGGRLQQLVPCSTGFRRFELRGGLMLLNGERLILNGVNRHEWNPCRGRSIDRSDMERAIEVFRRSNINAVRTCHYPNQSAWYSLCDENGIYVMDEANLESHGSWQKMGACEPSWNVPGSLPQWRECALDRARSMFERDKNHPSILFWSCGNESYAGECILAMSRYFHQQDPGRLVHYEGVFWNRAFDEISDVESRMYAPPRQVREYLESGAGKPYLLCEYMHCMGNSLGGMESYVRLLDEYPRYQGGFIWDYMDQALWRTDALGRRALAYGGDFGERPTDYAFSGNGLLFADGAEKPALQEVRYWYADPASRARFDRENQRQKEAALRQLAAARKAADRCATAAPPLRVTEGDVTLGVRGRGFEVLFSYVEGGPVSLRYGGAEWLHRAPRPAFWRATTENDKGSGFSARSAVWMGADLWARCTGWQRPHTGEDAVSILYHFAAPTAPEATADLLYTVDRLGRLRVSLTYRGRPGLPQLPLFGLRFSTPVPVAETQWLGLSGETYPDRKKGARFGVHTEAPHTAGYLVPQENGCHVDTLRLSLLQKDPQGRLTAALGIVMDEAPFAFSALPHTPQELEAALHREELGETGRTVITVLGAVRGVGGVDSWGADVEPAYQVSAEGDIAFSFFLQPGSPPGEGAPQA